MYPFLAMCACLFPWAFWQCFAMEAPGGNIWQPGLLFQYVLRCFSCFCPGPLISTTLYATRRGCCWDICWAGCACAFRAGKNCPAKAGGAGKQRKGLFKIIRALRLFADGEQGGCKPGKPTFPLSGRFPEQPRHKQTRPDRARRTEHNRGYPWPALPRWIHSHNRDKKGRKDPRR